MVKLRVQEQHRMASGGSDVTLFTFQASFGSDQDNFPIVKNKRDEKNSRFLIEDHEPQQVSEVRGPERLPPDEDLVVGCADLCIFKNLVFTCKRGSI